MLLDQEPGRIDSIERMGINALLKVFERYKSLGPDGLEELSKNEFGDTCLMMDFAAEEEVLSLLKTSNLGLTVISEEHGKVSLGENPMILATLDGIDGTAVYKKDWLNGRCGTMLAIAGNLDPTYNDVIFSGVLTLPHGDIYFVNEKGSFRIDGRTKIITKLKTSGRKTLNRDTFIYVDEGMEGNLDLFTRKLAPHHTNNAISSAIHWVDLAEGKADVVCEVTRKMNLELLCGYKLVTMAGGAVIALDSGEVIGDKKYLKFGQSPNEHLGFIAAATPELAQNTLNYLKNMIEHGSSWRKIGPGRQQ